MRSEIRKNKKLWLAGIVGLVLCWFVFGDEDESYPMGYGGYGFGAPGSAGPAQWGQQSAPSWGRDNFYGSRTGWGNYNADNSQGYVHVPGHGAVTYGF